MADARIEAVARVLCTRDLEDQDRIVCIDKEHNQHFAWEYYIKAAAHILAIADAHPSPAQLKARDLVEKCDTSGPFSTHVNVIVGRKNFEVMAVCKEDAEIIQKLINLSCGYEVNDE